MTATCLRSVASGAGPDEVAAIARNAASHGDQRWSLDQLATHPGEQGDARADRQARTNPSIGTLCRLADAFGVSLATGRGQRRIDGQLVGVGGGPALGSGRFGRRPARGTDRSSTSSCGVGAWQPATDDSEGHLTGTRELLAVLSGTLTLEVDGEEHRVETGGAVLFDADRPHRYRNAHKRALDLVLVVVQPPMVEPGSASHPS